MTARSSPQVGHALTLALALALAAPAGAQTSARPPGPADTTDLVGAEGAPTPRAAVGRPPHDLPADTVHRPGPAARFELDPALLVDGRNVLAIQGHNAALDSPGFLIAATLVSDLGRAIGPGDAWRLRPGRDEPPEDWIEPDFDHHHWPVGLSGFGYGHGSDAHWTTLRDMQGDHLSLYLRKAFVVSNTAQVRRLVLAVDYDDGFVAYLNGHEVARANLTLRPMAAPVAARDRSPDDPLAAPDSVTLGLTTGAAAAIGEVVAAPTPRLATPSETVATVAGPQAAPSEPAATAPAPLATARAPATTATAGAAAPSEGVAPRATEAGPAPGDPHDLVPTATRPDLAALEQAVAPADTRALTPAPVARFTPIEIPTMPSDLAGPPPLPDLGLAALRPAGGPLILRGGQRAAPPAGTSPGALGVPAATPSAPAILRGDGARSRR